MNRDASTIPAITSNTMDNSTTLLSAPPAGTAPQPPPRRSISPFPQALQQSSRMQYRSRPVSVAVDPVSLVISECIAITSAIQKYEQSKHSSVASVAAILGWHPNLIQLVPPSPGLPRSGRGKNSAAAAAGTTGSVDGQGDLNRWGSRGKKGRSMQDNPLISGFGRLRHELTGVKDIHKFDSLMLLYPFLQIIQAKGTAAPITILALRAIQKFLAYGFIAPVSPRFALAMQSLSAAITHCQFDVKDPAQEEVVLLMILHLMEDMLSGPGGDILSDESVCDMMGRGLTICSRSRFSEVLRRTAEASMVRMCQIIFEDLKHLEVEAGEEPEALDKKTSGDMDDVKMDPATNGTDVPATTEGTPAPPPRTSGVEPRASSSSEKASSSVDTRASGEGEAGRSSTSSATESSVSVDLRPYSLPSVRELFRVLVSFLDPSDLKSPDQMKMTVMALRIIHVALEVAGPSIARHPALAAIAEDQLCSHLFQLVRSDNMAILEEALTVASTLLSTCRGVLKLQQELYLSYLVACLHPPVEIPREPGIDPSLYSGIPQSPKLVKPPPSQASSGRSTPVPVKDRQKLGLEGGSRKPDARQAMVENIGVLARMPNFMVELFVNYDCDEDRADLCEDMIGLLSRNALPDSVTWSTFSVPPLCLDSLLRFIQFIAERLDQPPETEGYPDPDVLREKRRRKKLIIKGAKKFNESPKGGIAYLQEKGIIEDASNPACVARFLKGTSRVDKRVLGDFISKKGNEPILDAFMESLDFNGKRVDEAIRVLLATFRLPGESSLIERIISSFSEKYLASDVPEGVADKDACFILTYAIIMLNTDQHNPNFKQARMAYADFAKNLKGVNGGQDFAPEYIQDIYDAIKSNEIILPEEHENKHAFEHAWKELLTKTESAGPLVLCDTNIYDADMFATTWNPIVSCLFFVFMSASEDTVYLRVITGFVECARIATKHGNTEALDEIIYRLSYISALSSETLSNTSLNTEVQVEGNSVMVSELAVKFGRDLRSQFATLALFRVVAGSEHVIRKSWKYIIRIWLNLFVNSLIPPFFETDPERLSLPPIPLQNPSQVIDRGAKQSESGFFSAFTSYISSYAADDPPEPSDEELDSTLCTVDCVNQCHIGDVFANISHLPSASLESLVDSLLEQIPDDSASTVITVRTEAVPGSPSNGQKSRQNNAVYDPALVYILEFCTSLALRDKDSVQLLGKRVVGAIQAVLRDVNRYHPILIERATFYLFNLLEASYDYDYVRVPVLLHTVSSFSKDILMKTSKLVLQGLKLCIEKPCPLRNEIMTSPDFWVILNTLAAYNESAPTVFDILESGVSAGSPSAVMADNYETAVALLNEFATMGSVGAMAEQKMDRRQGGRKSVRPVTQGKPSGNAVVARGIRAINLISRMTERIPYLMKQSHLESREAWSAYWLPIFTALTTQCTNPCREVRHLAFASLQRSLLSPELTSSDHEEWTAIFGEVLFPLILRLLKPEVFSTDRDGMSETRVQAASLLCKIFLQYLVILSKWDGMLDLWLKIIEIMDRLMNSGQGDSLEEAVPENLKNVLLIMSTNGYLVPPSQDPEKAELWNETWKRIDRFLPDLRADLALDEAVPQPQPTKEEQPQVEGVKQEGGEVEEKA
ncbi:ARF guanine-nucleotide exchange factor 2 [Diplogelasinospora grovesii]|uniref:ARF guanine-nucleotide exchange factor 2 n=1 Tax=Diplogelasinospora grovesii TaxID=303347 RepID=A0AAN6NG07_9PEZI|nr:ARF guanine-nucleotide exchange factor 2 [Diplogelasinospora grovesii]